MHVVGEHTLYDFKSFKFVGICSMVKICSILVYVMWILEGNVNSAVVA